jgi:hypothetical protein
MGRGSQTAGAATVRFERQGATTEQAERNRAESELVASPLKGAYVAHPVIANGRLRLRDQDLLFCLDVKVERVAGRDCLTGPSIRSSADTLA